MIILYQLFKNVNTQIDIVPQHVPILAQDMQRWFRTTLYSFLLKKEHQKKQPENLFELFFCEFHRKQHFRNRWSSFFSMGMADI